MSGDLCVLPRPVTQLLCLTSRIVAEDGLKANGAVVNMPNLRSPAKVRVLLTAPLQKEVQRPSRNTI
jgi:hypothetical protein